MMQERVTFTMPEVSITIPEWLVWTLLALLVANLLLDMVQVRLRWKLLRLQVEEMER